MVTPLRMVVRLCFVVLLILGLLSWFADLKIDLIHIGIGVIFVLAMWGIALTAYRAAPALRGMSSAVFVLGLVMVAFGLLQASILPGNGHVVIQLGHIAMGVIGIGLTEALGSKLSRAQA